MRSSGFRVLVLFQHFSLIYGIFLYNNDDKCETVNRGGARVKWKILMCTHLYTWWTYVSIIYIALFLSFFIKQNFKNTHVSVIFHFSLSDLFSCISYTKHFRYDQQTDVSDQIRMSLCTHTHTYTHKWNGHRCILNIAHCISYMHVQHSSVNFHLHQLHILSS